MAKLNVVTLRLTLRPGTVYYFPHRRLRTAIPHFFVVINKAPLIDPVIVMACASSKIWKVQQRCRKSPGTYVLISPSEYVEFTKKTIIDCNHLVTLSLEQLITKINTEPIKFKNDMPPSVVDQIQKSAKRSPAIENWIKKLL